MASVTLAVPDELIAQPYWLAIEAGSWMRPVGIELEPAAMMVPLDRYSCCREKSRCEASVASYLL